MPRVKVLTAVAVAVSLLLIAPGSVLAQKAATSKGAAAKPSLVEAHVQMRNAVAKAHFENQGVLIKFSALSHVRAPGNLALEYRAWCGCPISFSRGERGVCGGTEDFVRARQHSI